MTDVMYVVGDGAAANGNLPLRWSLRSLARHAANVGRVIVAGCPPDWLSDEVVRVPVDDSRWIGKEWRISHTQMEAIRRAGVDRPCLYSSDDHYFLPAAGGALHDLDRWPRYCHAARLAGMAEWGRSHRRLPNAYEMCLRKTRRALADEGLPHARRYALHLDTWIDPADLAAAEAIAARHAGDSRIGVESQCLWGSLWESRHPGARWTPYAHDEKARTAADCEAKLRAGRPQFSTTPAAETRADVRAWMDAHYPDKSKWEK